MAIHPKQTLFEYLRKCNTYLFNTMQSEPCSFIIYYSRRQKIHTWRTETVFYISASI